MFKFRSRLLDNVMALFTIRGLEYVMMLILLPYLVRVLGPEKYGLLAFAQGVVQYFIVFTDYGFNLSAPNSIAVEASVPVRVRNVFSSVMAAKLLLGTFATVVYAILIAGIPALRQEAILYWAVFVLVLGNVVFPVWFFQGIQRMRYITYANASARILTTLLVLMFVRKPDDYAIAALLQASTSLLAGGVSFVIIVLRYRYVLGIPAWKDIRIAFCDGWDIFLSTAAISAYTASNIFFLGLFASPVVVGYYAAAEKLVKTITRLLDPVSQALYPHISALAAGSRTEAIQFLQRCFKGIGSVMLIVSVVLFLLAEPVATLIFGVGYDESVILLRIMAFVPFMIGLSNVFGIQTMLTFGMQQLFSRIVLFSALCNMLLVIPLAYFFQAQGVSATMLITETLVTMTMGIVLRRQGICLWA